ncbi:MAG: DNA repair protein RecO [Alphaproteobacteria bacterium]|nr:DNA repair protein RecO [Alphaproteobacteria bacterium]
MVEWTDRALCLGLRPFGETGAILEVFGRTRGRVRGLVYGGAGRRKRAALQPGNTVAVTWRARMEESLGHFALTEPEAERAARHLSDPCELSALSAVADMLTSCTPEGEAWPGLFDATETLLDALGDPGVWPALFVRWELGLLSVLGYGVDLSICAISGANDGLTHVSPRTGRAVRGSEAGPYLDRLLALPAFLLDPRAPAGPVDIRAGLRLTGHFLGTRLLGDLNRGLPEARYLMIDRLERAGRVSADRA